MHQALRGSKKFVQHMPLLNRLYRSGQKKSRTVQIQDKTICKKVKSVLLLGSVEHKHHLQLTETNTNQNVFFSLIFS